MGDSSFFDHHWVSLLINLRNCPPRGLSWKANATFFQEARDLLKALCETLPPGLPFFTKLRKTVRYYKEFLLLKPLKLNQKKIDLESSFETWQVQLHLYPRNKVNKVAIKDCHAQLQVLVDRKKGGHMIMSRTKWMKS